MIGGRDREARAVIALAVLSRAFVVLLAALARWLAPPYDASPALPPGEALAAPLAALLSWDGQHFLRLAREGYALEQLHAFFPLYPLLAARGADALLCLQQAVQAAWAAATMAPAPAPAPHAHMPQGRAREAALALALLLISNAAFVVAARLPLARGRRVLPPGGGGGGGDDDDGEPEVSAPAPSIGARARARASRQPSPPPFAPPAAAAASTSTMSLPAVAAALFCVAPSGVFMSAAYSESLFAVLSFAGMLAAELAVAAAAAAPVVALAPPMPAPMTPALALAPAPTPVPGPARPRDCGAAGRSAAAALWLCAAAAAFALAAATRSNGVLLAGYVAFAALRIAAKAVGGVGAGAGVVSVAGAGTAGAAALAALAALSGGALLGVLVALPLAAFELLGRWTYCAAAPPWARLLAAAALPASWGGLPAAVRAPPPEWCGRALLYAHVQRAYWGVGLLRYWQAKHLGMFVLAAPALLLAALAALRFFGRGGAGAAAQRGLDRLICGHRGGGGGAGGGGSGRAKMGAAASGSSSGFSGGSDAEAKAAAESEAAVREMPYALHAAALALVALLAMHVQVATRVLAACPAFYWAAARLARGPRGRPRLVLAFFLGYSCVGTVLFATHYNWT